MKKIAKKIMNLSQIIENPKIISAIFNGVIPSYARDLLIIKQISGISPRTIIDVGGHIGQSVKAMNFVFPKAKIHSFEPNNAIYPLLRKNVKKLSNIFTYPFGLASIDGKVPFWSNEFSGASSMLDSKEERNKIFAITKNRKKVFVDMKRFDNLNISIERPLYLKIDVEGAEKYVLKGFGELMKKVDILQVEYTFKKFYEGQTTFEDILKYARLAGLDSFVQLNINYTENSGLVYCDLIFFRNQKVEYLI
ncbi:FkbM family methyltransferase [Candidatus Pacearchaeota archaeon]|nr:FkbM family methyltransferase [Candidatus Pacearchaeota archaeon]